MYPKPYISFFFKILIISVYVFACTQKKDTSKKIDIVNTVENNFVIKDTAIKEYYLFPSPAEAIAFINEAGLSYKPSIVNSIGNVTKYQNLREKSLNLGVYIVDLMYLSFFNKEENIPLYFNAISSLMEEINLIQAIPSEILIRFRQNLQKPDSLLNLSGIIFSKLLNFVNSQNRKNTFSAISIGGYIECFYLGMMMIEKFEINNPLVQRLSEQKLSVENLYKYTLQYEKTEFSDNLAQYIATIMNILSEVEENSKIIPVKESKGQLTFKTEYSYYIKQDDFLRLKETIIKVRNDITLN